MLTINKIDDLNIHISQDDVNVDVAAIFKASNDTGGIIIISPKTPGAFRSFSDLLENIEINGVPGSDYTPEDAVKELNSFIGNFSKGGSSSENNGGVTVHNDLTGREEPECHPNYELDAYEVQRGFPSGTDTSIVSKTQLTEGVQTNTTIGKETLTIPDSVVRYATGLIEGSAGWYASDFIKIDPGSTIITYMTSAYTSGLAFYASNDVSSFISGILATLNQVTSVVPENAMYFRWCSNIGGYPSFVPFVTFYSTSEEVPKYLTIPVATEEYNGLMSAADKTKLDGISGGSIGSDFILKPNIWVVGTEYNFGDGLFGQRFQGNVTANGQVRVYTILDASLGNINIIKQGGNVFFINANDYGSVVNVIAQLNYNNPWNYNNLASVSTKGLVFENSCYYTRTNAPYDIWVLYTKN